MVLNDIEIQNWLTSVAMDTELLHHIIQLYGKVESGEAENFISVKWLLNGGNNDELSNSMNPRKMNRNLSNIHRIPKGNVGFW